jgi:hypothetical protein
MANYAFVARAWRNADAELLPFVRQARDGVVRLGGPQAGR